jgi:hypothetical protein
MIIKIHRAYRTCIALCDKDLIGKKFEDEIRQIDLSGKFFQGEESTEKEIVKVLKDWKREDAMYFIVGPKSCEAARKARIIDQCSLITIQDIPIAMVLL